MNAVEHHENLMAEWHGPESTCLLRLNEAMLSLDFDSARLVVSEWLAHLHPPQGVSVSA